MNPSTSNELRRRPARLCWRNVLVLLAACTALGVFGATLLAYGAERVWVLELLCHFRAHYTALACLSALSFLLVRPRWPVVPLLVLAGLNGKELLPLYGSLQAARVDGAATLTALLFNVHTPNQRYAEVAAMIAREAPDVVALIEVSETWMRGLAAIDAAYPHRLVVPRNDNFGIALLSKHRLRDRRVLDLGDAEVPSLVATVEHPAGAVTVLATHPLPPKGRRNAAHRDAQLAELGGFCGQQPRPLLVLGDLNVTPFSPRFRRLLDDSGLRDSAIGHGYHATWPAPLGPFGIPIDHCLHSAELVVRRRRVGPWLGSDHRPLLVDLQLRVGG